MGFIVETFETACTWDNFESFYNGIITAVTEGIKTHCNGKGYVTCRFTHVYPDGPAPYFSVVAKGTKGFELSQWDAIKKAASDAVSTEICIIS
jgi:alkyldihydroxyacetonephosphate synthase